LLQLKIKPLIDNSDLIKKSPIFQGQVSIYKKTAITSTPFAWVGTVDEVQNLELQKETADFSTWLLNWDGKEPPPSNDLPKMKPIKPDEPDKYDMEGFTPSILF
jgi:hypothetical protein